MNIGLIKVMGLATLEIAIFEGMDITKDEVLAKHAPWVAELKEKYTFPEENIINILREEVGIIFSKVLEHAGVYKRDEAGNAAFVWLADYVNQQI